LLLDNHEKSILISKAVVFLSASIQRALVMKKIILSILAVLIVAVVIITIGGIYFITPIINKNIPQIEKLITDTTGLTAKIENVSVSLFPTLKTDIATIELNDPKTKEQSLLLKNVALYLELMPLLNKKVVITKVHLDNPQVIVIKDAHGTRLKGMSPLPNSEIAKAEVTVPKNSPSNNSAPAIDIAVNSIVIQNGEFIFEDLTTNKVNRLKNFNFASAVHVANNVATISDMAVSGTALEQYNFSLKGNSEVGLNSTASTLAKGLITGSINGEDIKLDFDIQNQPTKNIAGELKIDIFGGNISDTFTYLTAKNTVETNFGLNNLSLERIIKLTSPDKVGLISGTISQVTGNNMIIPLTGNLIQSTTGKLTYTINDLFLPNNDLIAQIIEAINTASIFTSDGEEKLALSTNDTKIKHIKGQATMHFGEVAIDSLEINSLPLDIKATGTAKLVNSMSAKLNGDVLLNKSSSETLVKKHAKLQPLVADDGRIAIPFIIRSEGSKFVATPNVEQLITKLGKKKIEKAIDKVTNKLLNKLF